MIFLKFKIKANNENFQQIRNCYFYRSLLFAVVFFPQILQGNPNIGFVDYSLYAF